MANEGPFSFFYADAPTGSPLSYEALQSRRKIAEAMLGKRSPFPKTIGEGLTYLGEKIADNRMLADLEERSKQFDAGQADIIRGAPGSIYTEGRRGPAPVPASIPTPPPAGTEAAAPPGMATDTEYNAIDAGADLNQAAYDQTFAGTPLAGKSPQVAAAAAKYGVSPALIAGVMAHETGSGTSNMLRSRNNPAGIMDPSTNSMTGQSFPDIDTGIDTAGRVIANNYRRGGSTIEGMARSYAPPRANNDPTNLNQGWPSGVGRFYDRFTPQAADSPRDALTSAILSKTPIAQSGDLTAPATAMAQAPIVTDIPPAPVVSATPSQTPIPEYTPQLVEHPGEPPRRVAPPQPTDLMKYWAPQISNPRVSPETRELAKTIVGKEYERLKQIEAQNESDYGHQRTKYEQDLSEHQKSVREEPVRRLEYLQKQLTVEAAQQTNPTLRAKAIADLAMVNSNLEKARYEVTQRPIEEEKARLENLQKQKQLQGMTAEQSKLFQYFQTGVTRDQQLRHVADDSVLAKLGENLRNRAPVFGNAMVSQPFRAAKNSADAWLLANVRNETGAVIGKDEIALYYPQYFPVYGDTAEDVARKSAARQARMQATYNSLGDAKENADQFLTERRGRRASVAEASRLPTGTRTADGKRVLVHGYWEDVDPYGR
jgi:hypothetical protein